MYHVYCDIMHVRWSRAFNSQDVLTYFLLPLQLVKFLSETSENSCHIMTLSRYKVTTQMLYVFNLVFARVLNVSLSSIIMRYLQIIGYENYENRSVGICHQLWTQFFHNFFAKGDHQAIMCFDFSVEHLQTIWILCIYPVITEQYEQCGNFSCHTCRI